jgi:hypothetical protein
MKNDNLDKKLPESKPNKPAETRPNEKGSISVTGFVKIFDPKTKEVYVETRS